MTLTLRIDNFDTLDNGAPISIDFNGKGGCIGRARSMDWVLPDPGRHISSHHFDVTFTGGTYYLQDVSTNGTFLHAQKHRLDGKHPIQQGDRFMVGHYIIVAEMPVARNAPGPAMPGVQVPGQMPGQPQVQAPPPAGDDADIWGSFDAGASVVAAPVSLPPGAHMQQVQQAAAMQPPPTPSPPQPQNQPAQNQFGQGQPQPPMQPQPMPMPKPEAAPTPAAAGVMQPAAVPPMAAAPSGQSSGDLVRAFCKGAGLNPDDYPDVNMLELVESIGKCVSIATGDIMKILGERGKIKEEFRVGERTMRSATANNPMKFLPDAEQAVEAMFLKPRDGFLSGSDAFDNALKDIRAHQVAVIAALQPALAAVLGGISPDEVVEDVGSGVFGGSSKSKAWETFVDRWDAKADAGDNGMLDVFLEAFAKAYRDAHKRA